MSSTPEQLVEEFRTNLHRALAPITKRLRYLEVELRLAAETLAEAIVIEDTRQSSSKDTRAERLLEFAKRLQTVSLELAGERSAFLGQLEHGLQQGLTTPPGKREPHLVLVASNDTLAQ
jgi:hypothetical protein